MYRTLSAPLSLQFEVTGACNINCQHCYNFWKGGSKDDLHSSHMSVETANRLMKELLQHEVRSVVITGGEPLLNLDVVKFILQKAEEYNISVSMNSNLLCMTDDTAKELKELGLKTILTSFMGSCASVYEAVSCVPNSFEKAVAGVSCALNNGFKVACNMVTTSLNVHDVFNTAKFLKSIGVKNFSMTPASRPASCKDFSKLSLSKDEIIMAYNELLRVEDELKMRVDTLVPLPLCLIHNLNRVPLFLGRKCGAGVLFGMVSSGGIIRPCPNTSTEYGSVLEEGLSATWKRMTDWRTGERLPLECKECESFSNCRGGCRYRGESATGKPDGLDILVEIEAGKDASKFVSSNQVGQVHFTEIPKDKILNFDEIVARKEDFGAVISGKFGGWIFVNEDGMSLVLGLAKQKLVSTNEPLILQNKEFFLNLLNRRIIQVES